MSVDGQNFFNKQLERFQPSSISEIFATATRLKSQGVDVIDLSVGEPDFDTPTHIKQAAIDAINCNDTKYTATDGTAALKQAVSRKFLRDHDLHYSASEIAIDSGAKPLLFHLLKTLLDTGSEVIVPTPCWTSYPGMVLLAGGEPVLIECPASTGFKLQASDLDAAITPNTRVLMLNSPSNPTGAAYSEEEMKALTEVLLKYPHVWLISDEIYEHISFDEFNNGNPVAVEPLMRERTVIVNGVSKAYSMTGWRVGYAAGSERVMKQLNKVLSQGAGCPSSISQAAAVAALDGPQEMLTEWKAQYQSRRDYVLRRLEEMPGITCRAPQGAFYLYPCIEGLLGKSDSSGRIIDSSDAFARYLLEDAKVAVVPGSAFSLDPHFRLSYASSLQELERACDRMVKAVLALS